MSEVLYSIRIALHLVVTLLAPLCLCAILWRTTPLRLAGVLARALTRRASHPGKVPWLYSSAALTRFAGVAAATALVPALPGWAPASFAYDGIMVVGLLALSRAAWAQATLRPESQTRSEGRGLWPFLAIGAGVALFLGGLTLATGQTTFASALSPTSFRANAVTWFGRLVTLGALLAWLGTTSPPDLISPDSKDRLDAGPESAFLLAAEILELGLAALLFARLATPVVPWPPEPARSALEATFTIVVMLAAGLTGPFFLRIARRFRRIRAIA